ncbi:thermostable carboxypeptidase [Luminiphilus syltensis NOR5-1B]|uniref:Metal-dependent carboxypeptidase n=1 Tax=Luminiphilus syltensis NOR5-1B TaxID=565045 RepID=B8KXR7_9GAMM|nr:carboxypeptidase M32 [Luminiphilus syltensis]EED34774.1 thermostable carboxypeptidase [Luminiphilus syltensis NOR5-1B]
MNPYESLESTFKRLSALNNAQGILQWDQATMMPAGAAEPRSEVLAELSLMRHEILTDPSLADRIEKAESEALGPWQHANLAEIKRHHLHSTTIPGDLVEQLVLAESDCHATWLEAKPANDFKRLAPKLEALFALKREEANIKSEFMECSPYEALLDQYDPGRRTPQVDSLFADLSEFLPGAIEEIVEHQAKSGPVIEPQGPFGIQQQQVLSEQVMEVLDFPFSRGRLDTAAHPFSGGASGDIRITTRYEEDDFMKSLMAVIHEVGHALYEDGLPVEWRTQPVGESRGMTLHESQSLLLEMQAARSEEFIRFLTPRLRQIFAGQGDAWEPDNIVRLYRRVKPGLIRVYADEVTYPLHVIIRYQLETAIINDDIPVAELPGAWNELMDRYLGVCPETDTDGVMQDVHWSAGLFGYFPTYSLGALTAAQLFSKAKADDPRLLPGLSEGNFKPLFAWLDDNIRSKACLYSADELIERASGSSLGADAFKSHIRARYLA